MRAPAKIMVLLCAVLLLAGCASTALPEFDAEQTDRDVVPDVSSQSDVNAESTRYVGAVEGATLYLAQKGEGDTICLIHLRDQEWEQMGCATGRGLGVELDSGTLIEVGTYRFPDSKIDGEERRMLTESVSVISAP